MKRTLFRSFMTVSSVFGVLPIVFATAAHAQAPSRRAHGSYFEVAFRSPTQESLASPAQARSEQTSANADRRAAASAPVASGGSNYRAQRPASPPARVYLSPATGFSTGTVRPPTVVPTPSRAGTDDSPATKRRNQKSSDEDIFTYKS